MNREEAIARIEAWKPKQRERLELARLLSEFNGKELSGEQVIKSIEVQNKYFARILGVSIEQVLDLDVELFDEIALKVMEKLQGSGITKNLKKPQDSSQNKLNGMQNTNQN